MPPIEEWVPVMFYVAKPQPGGGCKYAIVWGELPADMWEQHVDAVCRLCMN